MPTSDHAGTASPEIGVIALGPDGVPAEPAGRVRRRPGGAIRWLPASTYRATVLPGRPRDRPGRWPVGRALRDGGDRAPSPRRSARVATRATSTIGSGQATRPSSSWTATAAGSRPRPARSVHPCCTAASQSAERSPSGGRRRGRPQPSADTPHGLAQGRRGRLRPSLPRHRAESLTARTPFRSSGGRACRPRARAGAGS